MRTVVSMDICLDVRAHSTYCFWCNNRGQRTLLSGFRPTGCFLSKQVHLTIIQLATYMYVSRIACVRLPTPKRLMSLSPKSQVMFASAFS